MRAIVASRVIVSACGGGDERLADPGNCCGGRPEELAACMPARATLTLEADRGSCTFSDGVHGVRHVDERPSCPSSIPARSSTCIATLAIPSRASTSDDFSLPIRLGLANAKDKQDLIVSILSPGQRYELANYKNATTNLDVKDERDRFGECYAATNRRTRSRPTSRSHHTARSSSRTWSCRMSRRSASSRRSVAGRRGLHREAAGLRRPEQRVAGGLAFAGLILFGAVVAAGRDFSRLSHAHAGSGVGSRRSSVRRAR